MATEDDYDPYAMEIATPPLEELPPGSPMWDDTTFAPLGDDDGAAADDPGHVDVGGSVDPRFHAAAAQAEADRTGDSGSFKKQRAASAMEDDSVPVAVAEILRRQGHDGGVDSIHVQPHPQQQRPQQQQQQVMQQTGRGAPQLVHPQPQQAAGGGLELDPGHVQRVPSVIEPPDGDKHQRYVLRRLMKSHTCYELLPQSGKVLVFDIGLRMKEAFQALVEHEINCAPLWDSQRSCFVGMLSASDFVYVLRKSREQGLEPETFETQTIESLTHALDCQHKPSSLVGVSPEASVFDACQAMLDNKIHRTCVVDSQGSGGVLHIITHVRVLRFVVRNLKDNAALLSESVEDLGIGTFGASVFKVTLDSPLTSTLDLLTEKEISSAPVVDSDSVLQHVYSKGDVTYLVKDRLFVNLDISVREAISKRPPRKVHTCQKTETLHSVMYRMASLRCHRLICVDLNRRVIGVVALSDILRFLLGTV